MRTRILTAAAVLAVVPLAAGPAAADPTSPGRAAPTTIALLGDTPYGPEQREQFPALVDDVNRDRKVRIVLHAGDVKSGSESCGDALLSDSLAAYERFADPFVLTPGDNEWTDCHRTSAGSFVPTERLDRVRELFYPEPGRTLGRREATVVSQATRPTAPEHAAYVENVRFTRSQVVLASVHVVGSSNDLAPWDQLPGGDRPTERMAEFDARRAANLAWIDAAFDRAERTRAPGVVILMQAEPVAGDPGFEAERALLLERAAGFGRPVLLAHGDEHRYEVESGYGGVPNLTRLETFGDTAIEWLRLTVDPRDPRVFSWEPQTVG
ncbi:MAG: metallophosphoesterase [Dermatophilaceae bacterium]